MITYNTGHGQKCHGIVRLLNHRIPWPVLTKELDGSDNLKEFCIVRHQVSKCRCADCGIG